MIQRINGNGLPRSRCKTQKKQRPLLVTGAFAAKRTIYGNGRCVGNYCMGNFDLLQSKWRISPDRQHRHTFHLSIHAVCVGASWGMANFLPCAALPIPVCLGRCNRSEWARGGGDPRAQVGLAHGGDTTMNLLAVCAYLVTQAVSDRNDRPMVLGDGKS